MRPIRKYLTGQEGAARSGKKEFLQFISIAQGSLSELDTQVELAKELGFMDHKSFEDIISALRACGKITSQILGDRV